MYNYCTHFNLYNISPVMYYNPFLSFYSIIICSAYCSYYYYDICCSLRVFVTPWFYNHSNFLHRWTWIKALYGSCTIDLYVWEKKKKKIKELTLKSFIHNLFFYMMNTSYLQTFSSLSFSLSSLLWSLQPVWCPHSLSQRGGSAKKLGFIGICTSRIIKKNSLFLPLRNQTQNQIKHNFKNS